jgi:hypothetical protein
VAAQSNTVSIAEVIERLCESAEPSVQYIAATRLRRAPRATASRLQEQIRTSARVRALLGGRNRGGELPHHPYAKWQGAHWLLVSLAELGYPPGDESLIPLREQVLRWLLPEKDHVREKRGLKFIHASQEGNAIFALLTLGIADDRIDVLVERLLRCQWRDGGWNCDVDATGAVSSFMESLIPLRGLALHARLNGDRRSAVAARRAAQVFLTRRLYRRRHDGQPISPHFLKLHFPCYWHYDILFGLKVMAEAGFIGDRRCADALEVLESKRLADGGFPAEAKYYNAGAGATNARSPVHWGGTSTRRSNEFVTADALAVLKAAGRMPGSSAKPAKKS